MNHLAISGLLVFLTSLFSSSLVLIKGPKRNTNITWALFSLSVAFWGFGLFKAFTTPFESLALYWGRFLNLSALFIPLFFFHFVLCFTNLIEKKKKELRAYYIVYIAYFLLVIIFPQLFISHVGPIVSFNHYPKPGILYLFFGLLYTIFVIYSIFLLINDFKKSSGIRKNQIKYLLAGVTLGFIGGAMTFLPVYGIKIYPFGTYLVIIYVVSITYAILKYRLLDINIAFTRAGIFLIVYALVLGIPFWIGFRLIGKGLWILPVFVMALFATAGPFIYTYLRRHAEDLMLKEQHRYQQALMELSKTMGRIRDLDKLLRAITLTVVDKVKVSFSGIYLKDEEHNSYQLKHQYPKKELLSEAIEPDHPLIRLLEVKKRPITSEEAGYFKEFNLTNGLFIPCFIEDALLGFLVLGPKSSNQMYTPDDLLVFETLSYSTSLAIENSTFWKEIEDRHRKARLQEMDTYSYSLAHEIDNPMQVVIGQANLLKKYLTEEANPSQEKKQELAESFDFILEAARRVSGMVKAIRDFGSQTTGELKPLRLSDVIESFSRLYYPQFKAAGVIFEKEVSREAIFIKGEKPELMQALVILANNSLHAMKAAGEKKVSLKAQAVNHNLVKISFSDTGYGIKKENLEIIFTPFTTTKASSEGTGMGLYNAKKIIERHKGRIWAESEGEGRGATFFIELPISKTTREDSVKDDNQKRIF